ANASLTLVCMLRPVLGYRPLGRGLAWRCATPPNAPLFSAVFLVRGYFLTASSMTEPRKPAIHVEPIPALKDNYIWSLEADGRAAVVDPGEAAPVLEHFQKRGLELVAILATHHHADHVGGVPGLLERWKVPVYGPKHEPITTLTHPVGGG